MEFFVIIYLCSILAAAYIFAEDYFKRRKSSSFRPVTRKEIVSALTFTFVPVVNSVFVLSFIIAG